MVFLSSVGMLSCRGCPILWMIPCCLFEPPPSRYNFLKIQSMLFFLMLLSLWIFLFTPRSGSLHVLLVLRGLILPTAAIPGTSSSSQFLCETPPRPLDSLLGPPQGLGGGGGHGTNVGILGGVSMGHIWATSGPPPQLHGGIGCQGWSLPELCSHAPSLQPFSALWQPWSDR